MKRIPDTPEGLNEFISEYRENESEKSKDILFNYPTVYIHNWKETGQYEVYIGEANNIVLRTQWHHSRRHSQGTWQANLAEHDASLYIIGDEHFNKSLTLDIENRLIHFLTSADTVRRVHNMRGNPQKKYYPSHELDSIFRRIWRSLRKKDPALFPSENRIKDSAIYKASPLHKLTDEQERARDIIIEKVFNAIAGREEGRLIFIDGEAGTGKTVLNSSTFYELYCRAEEEQRCIQCVLLVNHDEQVTVYKQIAEKLGITEKYGEVVSKPTHFIEKVTPDNKVDVAFVDEAHLLWTQGKQAYKGKNQLKDIIDRARVTVVMFDENQTLTTEQVWEGQTLSHYRKKAIANGDHVVLRTQLRMNAGEEVIDWIDSFSKEGQIKAIPQRSTAYEIRIFESPEALDREIARKAETKGTELSRLIATYDWDYTAKKRQQDRLHKYWEVSIGGWHKPWNRELERDMTRSEKRAIAGLAWAEQPQTIREVGSTYTIQGFDLNYAGVILGPSVKLRNGKIIFDPTESCNNKATQRRTLSSGEKKRFGEELLQHEVRVLMTRGTNGLYIYACDKELREALVKASR